MGKIGRALRNYIAIGAMGLAALLPSKLNAQSSDFMRSLPIYGKAPASVIPTVTLNGPTPLEVIANPFSRPNIQDYLGRKHLDWYGSGDVNNDGKVDLLDATAIDTAKTDRADIDGDGVPGIQNDKQILLNYLNGKISYLPGHWNELTTKDERISWLEKMIKVDTTDKIGVNGGWICSDRTTQEQINFTGISNASKFIQNYKTWGGDNYSLKALDKFNIPAYIAGTVNGNKIGHSVMACLVGSNPLNFNDWFFWSAYTDKQILPGDFEMDANSPVSLGLEAYVQNPVSRENEFAFITDLVKFNLTNNVPVLEKYSGYLTLNNPNVIKVHVGNLEKIVVDSGKLPDGTALTPELLRLQGYKAIPDTSKEQTSLPVNLSYYDSDTTRLAPSKLGGSHYQFLRKFFSWIYSGGVTKKDSTTQIIEVDKLTAVEDSGLEIPNEFKLYQNYPNPFNPTTKISYSLPEANFVTLKIYDMLGREVSTLVNEMKPSGTFEAEFDASKLSSGTYVYKLSTGSYQSVKKMILTK